MSGALLLMVWPALFEFMTSRDPTFAASAIGVPDQAISLVETSCEVKFPKVYVDFLRSVGEDPDRYTPWGIGQDTDFYELVKLLPDRRYPSTQFWRLTRHIDASVDVREDLFLDLSRGDEADAPLVTIGLNYSFDPAMVEDLGMTLKDALVGGAFRIFELQAKQSQALVHAVADTQDETNELAEQAKAALATMGLELVFGPTPRFSCFTDGMCAALVEVESESMIEVSLAADSVERVGSIAESLTAILPHSRLHSPGIRV